MLIAADKGLTLTLLRHAKAGSGSDDIARTLTDRGRRDAAAMGIALAAAGVMPKRVLCSAAARTRETLERAKPAFKPAPAVDFADKLYLASSLTILARIHALADTDTDVLVIGHNPGIHALALDLIAEGPQDRIAALGRKMPTASAVVIGFRFTRWSEVLAGTGELIAFMTPADNP